MTEQTRSALRELQALDLEIANTRDEAEAYEPRILEVEQPANDMEELVERTRGRIKEMRVDERRLELSTTEKRTREEKLKDRLNLVRNVREEAAVNAELEMVQRALEAEETEALGLLEQIRRMELDLEEQVDVLEKAKEDVGPRRETLVAERDALRAKVEEMQTERAALAEAVDDEELRVYDAIRGDRGRAALAALTEDGACGNCFSMIPLQLQQEIIRGQSLFRCEGCGVILSAPLPEDEKPDEEPVAEVEPDAEAELEADGDEAMEDVEDGEEADAEAEAAEAPPAAESTPTPVSVSDGPPEPVTMVDEDAEETPEA